MKYTAMIVMLMMLHISTLSWAGDDPSIKGQQRVDIKAAMNAHISSNTVNNQYVIYDAVSGELKRLALKELHSGIVKKGDFYVSCADFTDAGGKLYDLDFLVVQKGGQYQVIQGLVHAADGKKRKYHVEG